MADLTTLANAKSWLGVSSSTDDALLQRLVTAASRLIETWCGRSFSGVVSFTETRNGPGGQRMTLANYPVTALSSLSIDGVAIPAAATPTNSGYFWDANGNLYLAGYYFTRAPQNVAVTYSAGYAAVPLEIEQACIELVGIKYRERGHIGESSKSLGGQETVSYITKDIPDNVKVILSNYKKVVPIA